MTTLPDTGHRPHAPTTPPTRASAAPPARTRPALAAVCLGLFMILLDGSALNVALPAVERDVHGSIAVLQWVVNSYTIPLASVLLTAGSIADRWGARRLFAASLAAFTAASVVCGLSPDLTVLVVARAAQGVAAGGLLPTTLTIIARTFPDPVERARAITAWGATGGLALVAGPIGGGVLTDVWGWRAIFLLNVPVGLVTLYLALRYTAETARRAARADLPGQVTAVVALAALVAWLIEGGPLGWTAPVPLALLAVAVAAAVGFVVVELRSAHPMLPPAIFRRAAFTASVAAGFALQFGGYGLQFMLALHLQRSWGLGASATGVYLLPFSAAWVFGTIVVNRRLVGRGPRFLLWTGAAVSFAGALLLLAMTGPGAWPWEVVGTALAGLGCGVFSPSLNASALQAVDPAYAGLGSAVLNTARQVGMALGVALLGTFVALPDALLGLRIDVALVASCFLAVVVLSLRYLPRGIAARR
ncbi:MFS transporter [Streptantibioticus cattleyicolor]|uniref:Drug resistance efflux protein n=1 Tax=Streptantibioticus cattleyicolor (strain ATCC 35852 / DSM 46488 / JCM 4925 / NBRC 14057 / NRRL 8057) TaxID=1003195 RepID=F8JIX4_STREN|nr:MFS transporter [Streptantibioticus cattleyicolor]AEW98940.1 drug resistance efflux protein [Streptantibioticus cattleyicolor NRRL 8057 = DSM 46488]CCB72013.1 Putative drug resistance transporter [Streptantibioticus cattleyicolor NRRL 8057 = DSM 46488]